MISHKRIRWIMGGAVLAGSAVIGVFLFRGPEGTTIDSWPVGPIASGCGLGTTCEDVIQTATVGLGHRDPSHAEVISVSVHEVGVDIFNQSKTILNVGGLPRQVVVFKLADGSWQAIGVGRTGISSDLRVWERP
ncbi:MAG: hypothetical protein EPO00_08285 [Chloroflexota bacterium]|nr:MAG: hypothetical protein EPO00_08285 [Chloroflexota bacterium]